MITARYTWDIPTLRKGFAVHRKTQRATKLVLLIALAFIGWGVYDTITSEHWISGMPPLLFGSLLLFASGSIASWQFGCARCLLFSTFIFIISSNGQTHNDSLTDSVSRSTVKITASDATLQIGKSIRCIVEDKNGNYWFATEGEGVCRYNPASGSTTHFTVRDGLCSNYVWTVTEDTAGNLWFDTRDGICRFDGHLFTHFTDRHGPGNNGSFLARNIDIGNLWQTDPGDLWFGANSGAHRYDPVSGRFTYFAFPESEVKPLHFANAYSQHAVYCTFKDRADNLWFGTQGMGVCRYEPASGKFTWFTKKGLNKAAVRAVFQDKDGNFWFGNNGAGVFRYSPALGLTNFTEEKKLGSPDFGKDSKVISARPGTLARIWAIAEDKTGNLWFGTCDAGAWRYDGTTLVNFTTKDGLTSNAVNTIFKDKAGNLWFGTDGGGVCQYDGKKFIPFHGRRSEM